MSTNECGELGRHISTHRDMLIEQLRPLGFAVRFRAADLGRARGLAPKPAKLPKQDNDGMF